MTSGGELGVVELGGTLTAPVSVSAGGDVPADPTGLPTFRVYGSGPTPLSGSLASLSKIDTGTITGASNATPIVVTSAAHGLQTGMSIVVSGVLGNTAANGTFAVTKVNDNSFSLGGSSGNGAYTSGGTWHVAGLYQVSIDVTAGNGYESGRTYFVHASWTIAAVVYTAVYSFRVI